MTQNTANPPDNSEHEQGVAGQALHAALGLGWAGLGVCREPGETKAPVEARSAVCTAVGGSDRLKGDASSPSVGGSGQAA